MTSPADGERHGRETAEPELKAKVIRHWGPVCEAGRHTPPHPGATCDDVDEWITLRNRWLADFFAQAFDRMAAASDTASLAGTAFATGVAQPLPPPEHSSVDQAIDILAPHLAWQPNYRP